VIAQVFQFSLPLLFAVFIGLGLVFYSAGRLALHLLSRHAIRDMLSMPQPAYLGTIATAWALSLGFIAADIWAINGRADHATSLERSALVHLLRSAEPDILNSQRLHERVEAYRRSVVTQEWQVGRNTVPDPDVEVALHDISGEIGRLARSDAPPVLLGQVVHDFNDLQEARNLRLAVGNTSVDTYKWYLVVFLTFLTAITIAATHADRKRAGRRALVLFSITASISLWILAIHANPYNGVEELHPSLLYTNHKHADLSPPGE
jgi:hypothetical protein